MMYWALILRDISFAVNTLWYTRYMYKQEKLYDLCAMEEGHESTMTHVINDFNLLLSSFIPL